MARIALVLGRYLARLIARRADAVKRAAEAAVSGA